MDSLVPYSPKMLPLQIINRILFYLLGKPARNLDEWIEKFNLYTKIGFRTEYVDSLVFNQIFAHSNRAIRATPLSLSRCSTLDDSSNNRDTPSNNEDTSSMVIRASICSISSSVSSTSTLVGGLPYAQITTNAGLIISIRCVNYVKEIHLELNGNTESLISINHLFESLGYSNARTTTWHSANKLCINYYPDRDMLLDYQMYDNIGRDDLQPKLDEFAKCIPNITSLLMQTDKHLRGKSIVFATCLANSIVLPYQSLDINFPVALRQAHFSNIRKLCVTLKSLYNGKFPVVYPKNLVFLKLYDVPFAFNWHQFISRVDNQIVEFSELGHFELHFSDVSESELADWEALVNSNKARLDLLNPKVKQTTKATIVPSSTSKFHQIANVSRKLMNSDNRFIVKFPKLTRFIVNNSLEAGVLFLDTLLTPSLRKFSYSGSFKGLEPLASLDLSDIESTSITITCASAQDHSSFYPVMAEFLNRPSSSFKSNPKNSTELVLGGNIDFQLNPARIQWSNLTRLEIQSEITMGTLSNILPVLCNLTDLHASNVVPCSWIPNCDVELPLQRVHLLVMPSRNAISAYHLHAAWLMRCSRSLTELHIKELQLSKTLTAIADLERSYPHVHNIKLHTLYF